MIEEFEEYTEELNEYEHETLLPIFVRCLSNKVGKAKAITNRQMCEKMLAAGYTEIAGARVRKIINYIRRHRMIPFLIAGGTRGYYIAENFDEYKSYLKGLAARRNSINEVLQGMLADGGLTEDDL